jgi:hypothetical protein
MCTHAFVIDAPKPAAEIFHNVRLFERGDGVEMGEHHVDLMDVNERLKLCPFWGGSASTRFNIDDFFMEEHGQDESAFWQNDSRKCHWHEKGEVRLAQGEKRQGVVSHCAVVMGVRHGVGGNLTSEATWAEHEKVRDPHDEAFKNPFVVWARVGGDCGCWGGAE